MRRLPSPPVGPYAPPAPERELTVVSADGSRLHAELHGPEDAPAVLLAHGWVCSTAFWAPVVRALAADHRVIVYDQRGHGRSPAPGPGGYSTHALADDLVAVLEAALPSGRRAVLAGHSMGGMTLMAAADRPALRERAAAVVLCSTGASRLVDRSLVVPLRSPRARARVHRVLLGSRAPLGPVTPLARRLVRYATMGPGADPAAVDMCARILHACPRAVRGGWGRVLLDLELEARIGELTMPTAVIVGTADRLTPPEHADALAAALPHCTGLIELPGLGHMTPVEDPEAVTGVICGLVEEFGTSHPTTAVEVKEQTT
ncbi:alpha/beta fold hydrolase [Streptomyces sp. WAC05858]|uniref:alpha/beta fold hydrolase n=1 Tax=Streptomyces TaxID=1883 RepID=UPI000F78C786|nr:alpha/beta fold hydrolase [Streptomyces sp. WAC05858]RSS43592.1 alpha/beta fold hydrolase [Streptomyces sp. WAC05858]